MHAQCQMPYIIQNSASLLHTLIPLICGKHVYTKEFKKPPYQPKHRTYNTYMYTRVQSRT